ncbi:hypothetical protein ABMA28_017386 [Loxostege sticticalis]|uniref:C2H2-type domain-containing protein n=1 Tax=Loxostege sticticalis TaxID=481309 RepID=A0ABD0S5I0_LOXSC
MDLPLKLVCWECTAKMRKIKLFQEQVERSQRLLLSHFADKQTPLPSLSRLTTAVIKPEHAFDIVFEETDSKTEIEIFPENFTTDTYDETAIKYELQNVQVKEEVNDDFDYNTDSNHEWNDHNVFKSEEEDNIDKAEHNQSKCTKNCESGKLNKHDQFKIIKKVTKKMFNVMSNILHVGFGDINELLKSQESNEMYKCRYKCKPCVMSWPKVEPFNRHNVKFHNIANSFVCEYCTSRFKSKSRLRTHIDRHRELFECRACFHRAAGRKRMMRHLANAHRVSCNACEATFPSVREFYRHYKKYHDLYICDYCGRKCRMKSTLEKHITNQHMENVECETCKMQFKNMKTLRTHVARKHVTSGGEDAYCVECDKQFPNAVVYREHIRSWVTHQKVDRKKIICSCPECGKTYTRRLSLQNHYNYVHKKQSKYVCRECDTQFLNRTKYANHIRFVHEGKKKVKNKLCTICGRGFSENRVLIHHMRTHTGERPHACALCPARFAQSTALRAHLAHVHLRRPRGNKC